MKLKTLIKDIPLKQVKGSKDIVITGICENSKLIAPGNLFVARKGLTEDGAKYIPEAIAAGASAILSDIYDPSLKNVTQLIHPEVQSMQGLLANQFHQHPSSELFMVAITGTNGKTTTSYLIKHLLDNLGMLCGVIGTIEYIIGEQRHQVTHSTPDVTTNHKMLREMVFHNCKSAVMEVTSHGLMQGRVEFIDYDVAVFTNLTVDHLDYHGTMDAYCKAKNRLFVGLKNKDKKSKKTFEKNAVINVDSPWHSKIVENCQAKMLTYGIISEADLNASEIQMSGNGSTFNVCFQGKKAPCNSPLIGRFNVYNVLAAIGVALTKGYAFEDIVKLISSFGSVPGRLQSIPNQLDLKIFVDFAHSDDALTNVLECLNELKKGKIITVFGCGGDRDRSKRPKMALASEEFSDITIVTTDNPRSEDPVNIIQQITKGFKRKDSFMIELDRYKAIEKAVEMATPDDIILIAGKGHEPYQIFAHKIIEFDDRKIASQICQKKYLQKVNAKL